ncbi:MAG: acyl--CoA ligase [Verrucomicrobia bacterium]|nr:MAG: acyl--CoA ligase [Verrucomicrobiota bacterium]
MRIVFRLAAKARGGHTAAAMLYDRWRALVRRSPDAPAWVDPDPDATMTFAELAAAAERVDAGTGPWVFPRGHSVDFVLAVLSAWRHGKTVCPLEPYQAIPALPTPPPGMAHLKFTSGSTGAPRGIAFTQSQIAADADHIVSTMGLRPEWPNLGVISLAHSYGFSNLVTPLLLHGIPLVRVPAPLPELLQRAAAGRDAVTLPAVPALWRAWHDAGCIPGCVRIALSAGAPLPLGLEQAVYARSGLKLHNFYGASECGGIAYDRTETPRTDERVTGTALDGVTLAAEPGGCLEVRGTAVGNGYWPESDPALAHGCFRTSDWVEIGESGAVRWLGRSADVVNVAGRKLAPETVETALRSHAGVRECVVFGVEAPDDPRGELLVACVEAPGVAIAELRAHAAARLPAWQVPREWWAVDTLGTGNRGKISRSEWRAKWRLTR